MASNRHLGRIIALQSLYEYDFRAGLGDDSETIKVILARNLERYADKIDDKDFVQKLTFGVAKEAKHLDAEIAPIAPEWPLNQIALVDHEILRIAIFELKNFKDLVPPKVAINEAVELAKAFGSENSSRFINGVLGTFWRQTDREEEKNDTKRRAKK